MTPTLRWKPLKPEQDEAADPVRVEAAALACLARRDHAAGELREKLIRRGFESDVVVAVVRDLSARGLQDDTRFIEAFINARIGRGNGPVKIAHGLRERGITAADADAAVATATDWAALARDVRRRRFGDELPPDWPTRSQQARFLQQRGFTGAHVKVALEGSTDEET